MAVPEKCTVLVVGGGPGGSYTASVLAREGIDTVLLEADVFPRYHIGESTLPSMHYFLDFIDLYSKFSKHGFIRKNGAAFKFTGDPDSYTDFLAAGGPENHAWNVVRSEADHIMFKHAGESGAIVFDGVSVKAVEFLPKEGNPAASNSNQVGLGRPASATWSRKDGSSGTVHFEYLVDASGRAGLVSTKYMKNRKFNQGLKNLANWGYWGGVASYGVGTPREGDPYFEALQDGSGWAWAIPLHNKTTSVGVVMKQDLFTAKKKKRGSPPSREFYLECLKEAPDIAHLLENATLKTDLKSASDWSYYASSYAGPHVRLVGDAGCFIDPLFSSGIHLALNSGLSAALTICASRKGDCSEAAAADWHTKKVTEGYTRFLMVVTGSLEQIYRRDKHILNDLDELGFDKAFDHFRPIIQGTVDLGGKLTKAEVANSLEFCTRVLQKADGKDGPTTKTNNGDQDHDQSEAIVDKMTAMHRVLGLESFTADVIDGKLPRVKRGALGLVAC